METVSNDGNDTNDRNESSGILFSRRTILLGSATTAIGSILGTRLNEGSASEESTNSVQPRGTNEVVFGYGGTPLASVKTATSSSTQTSDLNSTSTSTLNLPTVDTTQAGQATFSGGGGDYTLEGSGVDVWTDHDDYAAVYEDDVSGDIVASVTVESQKNTHPWAKAGLMIANDITAPGSSAGDLILATTPENGYALQWDDDGGGYVDTSRHGGATTYPAQLRVIKSGTEFTGEYSTDSGATWTTVGSVTIPEANNTQDVGVFLRGSKTDVRGTAEFRGFSVSIPNSTLDRPTVDTTMTGDASFLAGTTNSSGTGSSYTLEGSGVDVWTGHDDYAAVYEPDVSGDAVASVTVESQANTHPWAKAGLMIANDITAPGSSAGDLTLVTTPENGYALQWDENGDGYVDTSQHGGATTYPAQLRLTKAGTEFTGEYSTDGGATWTTVGTVTIPEANNTQDVGVFLRGSKTDVRGTAQFDGFSVSAPTSTPTPTPISTPTPTPTPSNTDTEPPYEFGEQGYGEYGYGGSLP